MKIGFIGQGYVGKNTANDFENRGYSVVRYALDPEYALNRKEIATCDIVFIAVPTPTTPAGFDARIVAETMSLVGHGKIAVIKSTLLPTTTKKLQDDNPNIVVLFSPEFLCEATAAYDTTHPMFNIIGMPYDSAGHRKAAEEVLHILPKSDHNFIVNAATAELFKYAHNVHGYLRVLLSNVLYDLGNTIGAEWGDVRALINTDPMMSPYYNAPMHKTGRGAGGNCFIKDMASFSAFYREQLPSDASGIAFLQAAERKNLELLRETNKDQQLVRGVYGVDTSATTRTQETNFTPPQPDETY